MRKTTKMLNDLSMVVKAKSVANKCLFYAIGCNCWPKANLGDYKGADINSFFQ